MLTKPKSRKTAAILAFVGTLSPISGFHKFYMGRPLWGVLYVLLSITPIPRVASLLEGVWYLIQDEDEFNRNFNASIYGTTMPIDSYAEEMKPGQVSAIAEAVRELDRLRQEGLITEYEFEQKRRQFSGLVRSHGISSVVVVGESGKIGPAAGAASQ
jgi:TM2 domain-containing membrane protein YozV